MQVQFAPEQFAILKQGFEVGDPSGEFDPDEMPVPVEVVEQVRNVLATSDGVMDLNLSQVSVLEACFVVGTESNPDIADANYDAILSVLRMAQSDSQQEISTESGASDNGACAV